MKERILAIFLFFLAIVTIWAIVAKLPKDKYARPASDFSSAIRNGADPSTPAVSGEVIRLHILADSDNEEDQSIKLAIRDVLLPYLNAATLGATTKEEALTQLTEQCPFFTELANTALTQLGADYHATVSVESLYFPIRIYGSQTYLSTDAVIFPPGFYDSVQIILGDGNGHNWWCLAYPSLCFIDASYDYVPKDSKLYKIKLGTLEKNTLDELFYGEAYDITATEALYPTTIKTDEKETTVYLGCKLWELLKKLFP